MNNTLENDTINEKNNGDDLIDLNDEITYNDFHENEFGSFTSNPIERVKELENNYEILNDSLMALSTQFAQIQYRIKQMEKTTDPNDQNRIIEEIKKIAFDGCTSNDEVKEIKDVLSSHENVSNKEIVENCKKHQNILIEKLRNQLSDLEKFAYETGSGELPSTEVMNRQRIVLEKLTEKLQLNLDIEKIKDNQMFERVDDALQNVICPIVEQEKLVEQLTTQIVDLERFVNFLQIEKEANLNKEKSLNNEYDNCQPNNEYYNNSYKAFTSTPMQNINTNKGGSTFSSFLNFGSGKKFGKNELKNTIKGNHYGDVRAKMEVVVASLKELMEEHCILFLEQVDEPTSNITNNKFTFGSIDLDDDVFLSSNPISPNNINTPSICSDDIPEMFDKNDSKIVLMVRREFCVALKDLLMHGVKSIPSKPSDSKGIFMSTITGTLNTIGCSSRRNHQYSRVSTSEIKDSNEMKIKKINHIWDVIMFYFYSKHAHILEDIQVRKLSQSFNLENVSGKTVTSKQLLLTTIENIITSHTRLKRSPDSMWKAFVCASLNKKILPAWIRMIFRTRVVVECCYYSWSYIARTGCEDIYTLLESLHKFKFHLPVDLAVRPFNQLMDAF
ncbi:RUN domain-containing protein [Strongyloides ratti]|uniref:RUN domain-containing protein n=1 Tax=Strongyloides ratti TaxID=34506 RepID=A0A090N0P7_STRRB|nr:RUN domain-containing protein [Strongyloides ratti]CEF71058.1 RUN domain-containing protein [Strongyloides ratti]